MTCTDTRHICLALPLRLFELMAAVEQPEGIVARAVRQCNATRHRDGTFKARPAREAVPLVVAAAKSAAHVCGAATKRAKWVALRDGMTAKLRAEARAVQVAF